MKKGEKAGRSKEIRGSIDKNPLATEESHSLSDRALSTKQELKLSKESKEAIYILEAERDEKEEAGEEDSEELAHHTESQSTHDPHLRKSRSKASHEQIEEHSQSQELTTSLISQILLSPHTANLQPNDNPNTQIQSPPFFYHHSQNPLKDFNFSIAAEYNFVFEYFVHEVSYAGAFHPNSIIAVAVRLLDYPTQILYSRDMKEMLFMNGKRCRFQIPFAQFRNILLNYPLYVMLVQINQGT